ncbi:MAG: pyruvate kinase alpha/beta domain-containing protein [Rhodopila sp.]
MSTYACKTVLQEGFAAEGDTIVVAAGTPIGVSGTTNTLKIVRV